MNAFSMFNVSPFDENVFNNQIRDFTDRLKGLKEKNPTLSNAELLDLFKKINYDFLERVFDVNSVRSDTFRYQAISELLSNPYEFKRLYDEVSEEIKNNPSLLELKENLFFPLNLRDCKKVHILDSIRVAKISKKEILESYGISEKQFDSIDLDKTIKPQTRADRESVKLLKRLQKPESTRVLENTRDFYNDFSKTIKKNYISLITMHYKVLDDLGLIDELLTENNSRLPKELQISKDYLNSYMSEESLAQLPFTELSALSSFYINKYTKFLQSFETGLYVLSENYSLDDLLEAEDPATVIPDLSKKILIKQKKILTAHSDDILDNAYSKANSKENVEKSGNMFNMNINLTQYKAEKDEFKSMFGYRKDDEYYKRVSNIFQIRNLTRNEYKLKDYSMLANLSIILNSRSVENWGLISDDRNGYDLNSDYILLGLDIRNLNMPLRLHMPSDMFKDFVREYMQTDLVPLYEGHDDFVQAFTGMTSRRLSTPLLYKPTPEGKKYLKTQAEDVKKRDGTSPLDRLISHLYMISDLDVPIPDHLKQDEKAKKKSTPKGKSKHQRGNNTPPSQSVKKKFVRRFLNITTKEIVSEKGLRQK